MVVVSFTSVEIGLSILMVACPSSNLCLAGSRKSYSLMTTGSNSMPASRAMWKAPFLNGSSSNRPRLGFLVPSG